MATYKNHEKNYLKISTQSATAEICAIALSREALPVERLCYMNLYMIFNGKKMYKVHHLF